MEEQPDPVESTDEDIEVRRRRYKEARRSGLSIAEAQLFSESSADVGVLRKLVAAGCPTDLIAAIVL